MPEKSARTFRSPDKGDPDQIQPPRPPCRNQQLKSLAPLFPVRQARPGMKSGIPTGEAQVTPDPVIHRKDKFWRCQAVDITKIIAPRAFSKGSVLLQANLVGLHG